MKHVHADGGGIQTSRGPLDPPETQEEYEERMPDYIDTSQLHGTQDRELTENLPEGITVGSSKPMHDEKFVVVWEHDEGWYRSVSLQDSAWVSRAYDLADCDAMEGIKEILALDEHGKLVPISLGDRYAINTDQECPLYFDAQPILAGTRRVGTVQYSDH